MLDSSDFMTLNRNLCLKRFIALLSLSCHGATQRPVLAPRGVLWCVIAQGKNRLGWFYFRAHHLFRFIGGLHVLKSEKGSSNINSNPSRAKCFPCSLQEVT